MVMVNLEPGDIFLTRGESFISKAIRYFSKSGGESRTEVNHVGLVTEAGNELSATIVEASSTVKRHKMKVYVGGKTKVAVYRPLYLDDTDLTVIVNRANAYVGYKYGYIKIIAHLLDWCLGGRYFFRRFAQMDKYPICSWVVASAYADAGFNFGVEAGAASPDDIWDFVTRNPNKYRCVHLLGKLG